jgi:hypothetical protein
MHDFQRSADDRQPPHFIVDVPNADALPLRFRMTADPLPGGAEDPPNLLGFADLNVSGSGQFSLGGLRQMKRRLGDRSVTIVDLRQESHGFVNGMAVSWYGKYNGANSGLTDEEARDEERRLLANLIAAPSIAFDYLEGKSAGLVEPVAGPNTVLAEEELVTSEGLGYRRFYVTDHHRPLDRVADRFINFVKALPTDTWLHFHCRGGVGRTTTFMLMYDMLRNAKQVAFDPMLERHRLNGGRDMYRLDPDKDPYKYKPAVERLAFITEFYKYCAENEDRYETLWSEWLARK